MTTSLLCLDLRGPLPRPGPMPHRSVLCLGNFDGVHRAHTALLEAGRTLAARVFLSMDCAPAAPLSHTDTQPREDGIPCGVFCFFRPSADYFPPRPDAPTGHLTSLREKLALFAAAGMDFVCLGDFAALRSLSPTAFLDRLETEIGCIGAVCGYNYRFGHRAAGTPADLVARFGERHTAVLPELVADGEPVSSTRIRVLLRDGHAAEAARLLGRPYSLSTTVTHGKQLGRTIGFPTANQYFLPEALIPAHGVYAARCHTPDGPRLAVANIGTHPTVDTHARVNCETYILDYTGNLYGHRMTVELLSFLRPEQRFSSIEALTAAIRADVEQVRAMRL